MQYLIYFLTRKLKEKNYNINYDVLLGFQALRKFIKTRV